MKFNKKFIVAFFICIVMLSFGCILAVDTTSIWQGGQGAQVSGKLTSMGKGIIDTVVNIGAIVAVAVLIVLGIMYITGSAEGKAKIKESMIPYVLGAVIVLCTKAVLGIIQSIGTSLVPGA